MSAKRKTPNRTSEGLRDLLFDEIEELRSGEGDPTKSLAVAHLARQIVNTAKVELEFHRAIEKSKTDGQPVTLGSLQLGGPNPKPTAVSAAKRATAA